VIDDKLCAAARASSMQHNESNVALAARGRYSSLAASLRSARVNFHWNGCAMLSKQRSKFASRSATLQRKVLTPNDFPCLEAP
jgi:hypothetical protein